MTHLHYDRAADMLLCGVLTSGLVREATIHPNVCSWRSITSGAVAGWEVHDFHRIFRTAHPALWLLWLRYRGCELETSRRVLADRMADAIELVLDATERKARPTRKAVAAAI
jgi:hypothetical protein